MTPYHLDRLEALLDDLEHVQETLFFALCRCGDDPKQSARAIYHSGMHIHRIARCVAAIARQTTTTHKE